MQQSLLPAHTLQHLVAGVDEAGRGPLAGSVVAAAVILDPNKPIAGLNDSKKLSEKQRDSLALEIKQHALAWAVAEASATEIDTLNILQATMLAMQRAVATLTLPPQQVWVDGNRTPRFIYNSALIPATPFVGGDALHACISAASILAKTARDAQCVALDALYPQYGFAQHKGYGTAQHLRALAAHGACPAHRVSFAPVRAVL